jgi:hypothetical protein
MLLNIIELVKRRDPEVALKFKKLGKDIPIEDQEFGYKTGLFVGIPLLKNIMPL